MGLGALLLALLPAVVACGDPEAAPPAPSTARPDQHQPCPRLAVPASTGFVRSSSKSGATLDGRITREDRFTNTAGSVLTLYSGIPIDDLIEDFEGTGLTVSTTGGDVPLYALGDLLAASWSDEGAGAGCTSFGAVIVGISQPDAVQLLATARYEPDGG